MPLSQHTPPSSWRQGIDWDRWRLPLLGMAALLILVPPAILQQQLFEQGRQGLAMVAHTRKVQADVRALALELREAEEAAMAIALGADLPVPRRRLAQAPAQIEPMIQGLMAETADNPGQQVRLGRLKEIVDLRLRAAAQIAALPDGQRAAPVRELVELYPVRDLLQELLDEEGRLLAERSAQAERQRRLGVWLGWGGMIVQVLLLLAVIRLLGRQVGRRLRAEHEFALASARAAAVLQTVREPIALVDGGQTILMHNAAFAEIYGEGEDYARCTLGQINEAWNDPVLRQRMIDVLARGRELWDYEVQQDTGGVARTLLLNARRMPLPDRAAEAVLLTLSDVTAQKAAQQRIVDLNRQLEGKIEQVSDINRELEAFSYSVSHDLRAPLRHVSGFADKLARHLGEGADANTRHYLEVIGESSRRMSTLIDDLLVYSRLGRSALRLQAVDMQSLVAETRAMLDAEVDANPAMLPRRVDWDIQPLPVLVADENMMRQVWLNLLGNAVKYSSRREVAKVQVGYEAQPGGDHHFWVRDNGAGFDMAYAGKLFGVFQRLHKASEFDGTGIGLASVRRVLARHGGRIWAEAAPDQGATFHFVIPAGADNAGDTAATTTIAATTEAPR
ncbi:MAG: ATP-binding protein [Pseudoxanthomonas sp.]